jgi:hypothetical protein
MTVSFTVSGGTGSTITTPEKTVAYFQVERQRAILYSSAELSVMLFDASHNIISAFPMSISCADSLSCLDNKAWSGSDEDIVAIVAIKLNLTYSNPMI